jgi:tetratricopeptide (TPR) repeat protein
MPSSTSPCLIRSIGRVTLAICLLLASTVLASEQSKRLYARGLVEFHGGRYPKALELFDEAVAADAEDVYARYYRAVTRGRLNDVDGAISDLQAVLAAKPDLDQAALDLGVTLVQRNQYRDALPWLEQAQRSAELDAQASLFRGIAQLRLGEAAAARQSFARAAAKDPETNRAARYYQGIAAYQEGKWTEAEAHFAYVAGAAPDTDMGREAAVFLAKIRHGERALYQLYGSVGFQYDSNVVLAPSQDIIKVVTGITKQADGRATLDAGGSFVPWRTDEAQLSIGYEFYQSLHFELTDFNIQDHRPTVQLVVNKGVFQFGMLGRYDYYLLDTDSFLQEATVLPWVSIPEGDLGRTEFSYRMRRREFYQRSFRMRDAFNHAASVRQFLYLGAPDRYLSVGYRFDTEDPIQDNDLARQFAYRGNEVNAGIAWAFPAAVSAELTYAFRREDYAPPSYIPSSGERRRDDEHQVKCMARKQLTDHLAVTAAYSGTINNSNDQRFDYERHIGSLALEVRY